METEKQVSTTEQLKRASRRKAANPTPAEEDKPLLEINTLAPKRPFVTIDDKRHDFRLTREFGLLEHQEFMRDSRRYDYLWAKGLDGAAAADSDEDAEPSGDPVPELDAAEQSEMLDLQEKLFAQTLVDPGKLRGQLGESLTGVIQRELLLTFTNAPLLIEMRTAMAQTDQAEEASSTTES